ncbi:hypothetical protein ABZ372_51045 [Streptomyces sp. NPDC005921]
MRRLRSLGVVLAAMAALLALPTAHAPAAHAADAPLSQGRTATASSVENAGTRCGSSWA